MRQARDSARASAPSRMWVADPIFSPFKKTYTAGVIQRRG